MLKHDTVKTGPPFLHKPEPHANHIQLYSLESIDQFHVQRGVVGCIHISTGFTVRGTVYNV
jgi:hypothetical protein